MSLFELSDLSLHALVRSLRDGPMQKGISHSSIQSIVGSDNDDVAKGLHTLESLGFSSSQIAIVLESILTERARHQRPESLVELVLSGPDVASIPMQDTAAVMHSLITGAQREILLVGYAVHDGRTIFRDLAERMDAVPTLEVTLCLNIGRGNDATVSPLLVRQFAESFQKKHWPGRRLPRLYYFPPSLELDPTQRGSLHAKCVVVDRTLALVTSANFTEAAQRRNIELGLLLRHAACATRIAQYFEGLWSCGNLVCCELE